MVDPESLRDILLVDYGFFVIISIFFLLCCRRFQQEKWEINIGDRSRLKLDQSLYVAIKEREGWMTQKRLMLVFNDSILFDRE
jgi:hypothetical protein